MNSKYIARSSAIAARRLGDQMIVMSALNSTLFTLNEVAAVIWQAADGKTPLADIVTATVCREFDVEPAVAYQDAEGLVSELAGHGILVISEQPISTPALQEIR
jgi:Coenzyme PQQ synthesis protein D (PqqD)